jgi:hypothetical protein
VKKEKGFDLLGVCLGSNGISRFFPSLLFTIVFNVIRICSSAFMTCIIFDGGVGGIYLGRCSSTNCGSWPCLLLDFLISVSYVQWGTARSCNYIENDMSLDGKPCCDDWFIVNVGRYSSSTPPRHFFGMEEAFQGLDSETVAT